MAFCGSTTGGNILHSHPYVAPMMFWRNFQHWGQQYVSSVIHIVDGIPTTTPTCIQVLRVFFLHKSFCLLDDQCAFTIALLGHLLSFKNGPHVSYKKKQMALSMQCSAAAQDWNCLRTLSGCIQGGAYGRRPSTHCARLMPSMLYWSWWGDDLGYS